jgi:DNA mismatch repair protein MutS2
LSTTEKYLSTYPLDISEKLEFDQIQALLSDHCISDLGLKEVRNMRFHTDAVIIQRLLNETLEFKNILLHSYSFPLNHYIDISDYLKLLSVSDAVLAVADFFQLSLFLSTVQKVFAFFAKYEEFSLLKQVHENIPYEQDLLKSIHSIIDENEHIRNNASRDLSDIRKKISKTESEMESRFQRVLKHCKEQKWLHDDEQSVRRGDRVLAVESKYKRKIKGLILDESATGKTVFYSTRRGC